MTGEPMDWQPPFPRDTPENHAISVQRVTMTFTVNVGDPRRPGSSRTDETTRGLRVIRERVGEAVVVRATGELDRHNADVLAAALRTGWETAGESGLLVVDLSGVPFFSVAGLELLITAEQQCRERHITLRVVAVPHCVHRALRITGLTVLFDIKSTVVAAVRPRMNPVWTIRARP